MNNKLFFLILSIAMVILSIVTICTAPIVNGNLPQISGTANCQDDIDHYNYLKDLYKNPSESEKKELKKYKLEINLCKRKKAMYGLEYSSLIVDIVLGTLCCVLGLLHYFDVGNYCVKVTGIIGLASGVIGFVLTIVYVGYSAYIFDNDYSGVTLLYDNGAILRYVDGKYVRPWKSEDLAENAHADKAKYRELGKKQYNYNSKIYKQYLSSDNDIDFKKCINRNEGDTNKLGDCEYIWEQSPDYPKYTDCSYKYGYDRWLTSIILSCLIFVCALGVAVFGLFLFLKGDSNSSGHTPMN